MWLKSFAGFEVWECLFLGGSGAILRIGEGGSREGEDGERRRVCV